MLHCHDPKGEQPKDEQDEGYHHTTIMVLMLLLLFLSHSCLSCYLIPAHCSALRMLSFIPFSIFCIL